MPSPAMLGGAWSGALETWWGNKSSSNPPAFWGQCVVSSSFAAMEGSGALRMRQRMEGRRRARAEPFGRAAMGRSK